MTRSVRPLIAEPPRDWLRERAEALCRGSGGADAVVPELAAAGLFRVGVPERLGGAGGDVRDAIRSIGAVAEFSLTAAFVFWGQRTFIEYLLEGESDGLRERWLPELLDGRTAGATGLSNAMKYLSGIESLQIEASPHADAYRLDGGLPWVTNLRLGGFVVAAAVSRGASPPAIVALDAGRAGLERSPDLDLLALRGSNTAALRLTGVPASSADVIAADAQRFLPRVRPAFVGMQCGLALGLARAALAAAREQGARERAVLPARIERLSRELEAAEEQLFEGLAEQRFVARAAELFRLRITLAELAQRAVELELHASGGRAYLTAHNASFARHWREAAFLPVLTPSITQLQAELVRHGEDISA
jgi:alkylation response protein AidB-like acyl-CoA dehydrogenase